MPAPLAVRGPSSRLLLPPSFLCFWMCLCGLWPRVQAVQGHPALAARFLQAARVAHSPPDLGDEPCAAVVRLVGSSLLSTFSALRLLQKQMPSACRWLEGTRARHRSCRGQNTPAANNEPGKAMAVGWDSPAAAAAAESSRFSRPGTARQQQLQMSRGFCEQLGSGKGAVWGEAQPGPTPPKTACLTTVEPSPHAEPGVWTRLGEVFLPQRCLPGL